MSSEQREQGVFSQRGRNFKMVVMEAGLLPHCLLSSTGVCSEEAVCGRVPAEDGGAV